MRNVTDYWGPTQHSTETPTWRRKQALRLLQHLLCVSGQSQVPDTQENSRSRLSPYATARRWGIREETETVSLQRDAPEPGARPTFGRMSGEPVGWLSRGYQFLKGKCGEPDLGREDAELSLFWGIFLCKRNRGETHIRAGIIGVLLLNKLFFGDYRCATDLFFSILHLY